MFDFQLKTHTNNMVDLAIFINFVYISYQKYIFNMFFH